MKNLYLLLLLCIASSISVNAQETDYTSFVRPNIGSAHSRYFFYTPAALPFGMAKLAPSTNGSYGNKSGWEAVGYDDGHQSIEGFANFHEFQIGGLLFAPTVGKLQTKPGTLEDPYSGYRSTFDKKDEYATAGYYRVKLQEYDVVAELTATERVGYHRYTFPKTDSAHVIFDIGHQLGESGPVRDAEVFFANNSVWGYVVTQPVYVQKYQEGADIRMYFYAELDKSPTAIGVFNDQKAIAGQQHIKGAGSGLYLTFTTAANEAITIKTGLSYTSIENAKDNLAHEGRSKNFDQARTAATQKWNSMLGRIQVEGGKTSDKTKFYTGLYHALLGRGLASDVNGSYPKNDGTIGQITRKNGTPIHHHYNTDAIWGAFWNLTQLWAIAYPEYYNEWIQSQLLVYRDAGWLGDGIANSKFVSGVGTNFTGLAIAAGYNVGIRNYDIEEAYAAVRKNELEGRDRIPGAGKLDVAMFVRNGYVPFVPDETGAPELMTQGSPFGASHTLEYAFSASAAAQFARALNKQADYKQFVSLSTGWRTLYDPKTGFLRPKDTKGAFLDNFNPFQSWRGFQEGNAWQYTFYVPHEPEELVKRVGHRNFVHRLDSIFTVSQKNVFGGGTHIDAFAGIEGLYNHGNQPNLHISWLFNFADRPDLSQKWVRAICDEFYGTDGIHGYGYGQDEDQGQLGAWYVLASMGLFDVKGLTAADPSFQIGTPLFDKITISLPKDIRPRPFVISITNPQENGIYIDKVQINGRPQKMLSLPFRELSHGGKLEVTKKASHF
ncbi:glycoside hydrolase family 92 protein [Sphingobacterium psychroaquaticum]|uniref:GH92 family glycosyl hydrolase n=1 Tax=Sphingobacterium psychroaquaticum TaxID=561061 RepID=UPI00106D944A|nr:GH92 family glycosyl hydrolase [Sphingobacterium psychroaquaticum]QBQ41545.1 glycoside hydrolase family 92 protein [Sphingobacterium psychroaquaticum]